MNQPDFMDDERYLIDSLKASDGLSGPNAFRWGYLLASAVLVGFAAYYDIMPMMIIAFFVIYVFRIYEDRYGRKWTPLWRSIIEKYERAIGDV